MNEARKMAVDRAVLMLRVVTEYMRKHPVRDYEITYDEAVCDGYCLTDDCETAAEMLVAMFDGPKA
jgi:hypothetical protein